jgi:hypothetical protein
VGASQVDFRLIILPIRLDRTVNCTRPGVDCELVSLVVVILRYLHEVTVKGSITLPGTDIGQTHSGSLDGKSTITVWKLAPRRKSFKQVSIVTILPYPSLFLT